MAEYIEKKTAVEFFETLQNGTLKDGNTAAAAVWKLAAGIVKRLPKAEVVPVVHGRWMESGPLLECQSCGEIYSRLGGNAGKLWNYCPNCGAKMDGGDENAAD